MTRQEYTARLLGMLRHVTKEERAAIRAEIEGHMEDHMEGLLDLGYDEALAEERTLAAMGDPEEAGRELDKQYPLRWLAAGRIAFVMTAILCALMLFRLPMLSNTWDNLQARLRPGYVCNLATMERSHAVDIRRPIGNDILYIHHVSVGIDQANGVLTAEVSVCAYDRIPRGTVSHNIDRGLSIENQRGESFWDGGQGGGTMTGGAVYHCRYVPVEPDDEYVTLFYDGFGEHIQCRVPLPKEGTP